MFFLCYSLIIIAGCAWIEDFSYKFKKNTLSKAEILEKWLQQLLLNPRQIPENSQLPEYKFFTNLIKQLLYLRRTYGADFHDSFSELRSSLLQDQDFEKKIKSILSGAYGQACFIFFVTWIFIFACFFLLGFQLDLIICLGILSWQILGLCLFHFSLISLKKTQFRDLNKVWLSLMTLKSLSLIPISLNDIFSQAKIRDLENVKHKEMINIRDKIFDICRSSIKQGASFQTELIYLVQELKQIEKQLFEKFEKLALLFKLSLLTVFFLPSYLAFIFTLLRSMLKTL